jgi:hypothetical protein
MCVCVQFVTIIPFSAVDMPNPLPSRTTAKCMASPTPKPQRVTYTKEKIPDMQTAFVIRRLIYAYKVNMLSILFSAYH